MKTVNREKRTIRRLVVRYLGGRRNVSEEVRKGIDKKYNVHSIYFDVPDNEAEFFYSAATDARVSKLCGTNQIVKLDNKSIYKWVIN